MKKEYWTILFHIKIKTAHAFIVNFSTILAFFVFAGKLCAVLEFVLVSFLAWFKISRSESEKGLSVYK